MRRVAVAAALKQASCALELVRASLTMACAALALVHAVVPVEAQDTTTGRERGVRIGLSYEPGTRPGVVVLPVAGELGDSVRAILERDLDYSDRVRVIGLEGTSAAEAARLAPAGPVNYELWMRLGAVAVVQAVPIANGGMGGIGFGGGGGGLRVALHDVRRRALAQSRDFPLPLARGEVVVGGTGSWRLAVHGIADEVERWITGTRGIAQTRVLFVRNGRVFVVDSDGEDERPVTSGAGALSPAWHPSGRYIAYSQFGERGTQILVRDLASGSGRVLSGTLVGLNITPEFAPDGRTIVYAHGRDQGTDLFATDAFAGGAPRRVTVGRGTDNVSPSFSADGQRIAFTSGRSGHPEVYVADADGANAELLTPFNFGDQNYRSNPAWSPAGRDVAFQSRLGGSFQIMTISLRDRTVKQHTHDGVNEDPSFAPDGRHIVFTSTRGGPRQLFVLDTETGRTRQLTRLGGARLASWSRYLDRSP